MRQNDRMTAAAHRNIERPPRRRDVRRKFVHPLHDEGRRVIL
jgi:hypothetical protein